MTVTETPAFTRAALALIGEDSLFELKIELITNPDAGDVIPRQERTA